MKPLSTIRSGAGRKGGSRSSLAKVEAARKNAALGGLKSTEAKADAARRNGAKGGRPKRTPKSE